MHHLTPWRCLAILADLEQNGPATETVIAKRTHIRFARVRESCNTMLRDGRVRINHQGNFERCL